jgi:hypothetical protein
LQATSGSKGKSVNQGKKTKMLDVAMAGVESYSPPTRCAPFGSKKTSIVLAPRPITGYCPGGNGRPFGLSVVITKLSSPLRGCSKYFGHTGTR